MKHLKKFNESFEPIVGQRKLSDNFKKIADLLVNLIESTESLNYLKDMAKEVKIPSSEMDYVGGTRDPRKVIHKEFCDELKSCFPKIDFDMQEHLKTGIDIPFYGKSGSIGVGGNPIDTIILQDYIISKLGGLQHDEDED
jgi:hypothetical protein